MSLDDFLHPCVEGSAGKAGIALLFMAAFREGKLIPMSLNSLCRPDQCALIVTSTDSLQVFEDGTGSCMAL